MKSTNPYESPQAKEESPSIMEPSVRKPQTGTLVILGLFLWPFSGLFAVGVHTDTLIGQLKINWPTYSLLALALLCFAWSALRGVRYLFDKIQRSI